MHRPDINPPRRERCPCSNRSSSANTGDLAFVARNGLIGDAEALVHERAGRRVLQMHFLARLQYSLIENAARAASWKPDRISFFLPGYVLMSPTA